MPGHKDPDTIKTTLNLSSNPIKLFIMFIYIILSSFYESIQALNVFCPSFFCLLISLLRSLKPFFPFFQYIKLVMDNDRCILCVVSTTAGNQDQTKYTSGWVLNHIPEGRVKINCK